MLNFIFGLFFTALTVVFWVLLRTYEHIPERELKRLARGDDEVARLLYRASAYGASLRALLVTGIVLWGVLALACMAQALGFWGAVVVLGALIGIGGFVLVPSSELTHSSLWLAKRSAPAIAWLLERAQPVVEAAVRFMHKHRPIRIHTGLYEKPDLVELLEQQKHQPDSRISPHEIDMLQHSLTFGDKLVANALVPKRVVKMVNVRDALGPILMDELSKSGHSRFPVYDGAHDNVVGVLYLHDLVGNKRTGTVGDIMSTKLTYVHEDFTLYQALQAFLKTKRHLFLVVNSFEELVGILTIEDVLEQMIGRQIVDEFDKYDDLRAVAAAAAKKEHADHRKDKTEPVEGPAEPPRPNAEATPDAQEVVE